jgi:hypothetical protein
MYFMGGIINMSELAKKGLELLVTTGVSKTVSAAVESFVKPKLETINKKMSKQKNIFVINEKINKYIEKSCNKCLYMNTIVFKNDQKRIDELYIPLTVVKNSKMKNDKYEEFLIDKYRDDFIQLYKRVLLVDTAGMGKSTIIKYLYLNALAESKGIPILIELRKLDKDISIVDFIMSEMNGIREHFSKEDVLELIEGGDFIFFFDGYDEVVPEAKQAVTNNLQEFISEASSNLFIMSSREESELTCFGDFQRFDIKSLSKDEAYSLIKKYDKDGELSKELIDKLNTEENLKILNEFLENPLMVSLLYKAFEYKRTIPYKKHIFYRQVYDALFEEHDLSKGGAYNHFKRTRLDLEDFHRILRSIGFITLAKGIIYSKEELIEIIKQAKAKNRDINFNENDLIYDLTHSVPIFVKDGVQYRWSHKSFQEYFAASYISIDAKDKQHQLLTTISSDNKIYKYYNVLDFCYDIDYKQFSRIIIYPLLNELIMFYNNNYCDEYYYRNFNEKDILLRKSLSFCHGEIKIRKIGKREMEKMHNLKTDSVNIFNFFFEDYNGKACSITNDIIGIIFEQRTIGVLLKLLYHKKLDIVKTSHKIPSFEITDKVIGKINIGKYTLNDSVDNKLNSKSMFNLVSEYIIYSDNDLRDGLFLIFDYDKCVNLKHNIEEEIKNEKDDVDFL